MAENTSSWSQSTKVVLGVLSFVAAILLIIGIFYAAGWAIKLVDNYAKPTQSVGYIDFSGKETLGKTLGVTLGFDATEANQISIENLVLYVALFLLVFFTFSEIIAFFTVGVFSPFTSWLIGFFLAVIVGTLKLYKLIVGLMVGVAIIGGFSLAIILISAFLAAVVLNVFVGKNLKRWAMERQAFSDTLKSQKGANRVTRAIKGLKKVSEEFEDEQA